MVFIAILTLLVTIYIQFFKREVKLNDEEEDEVSITDVVMSMRGFYLNRKLHYLCLVFFFFRLGFAPIDAGGYLKLIGSGFPVDTWVTIGIILFPL